MTCVLRWVETYIHRVQEHDLALQNTKMITHAYSSSSLPRRTRVISMTFWRGRTAEISSTSWAILVQNIVNSSPTPLCWTAHSIIYASLLSRCVVFKISILIAENMWAVLGSFCTIAIYIGAGLFHVRFHLPPKTRLVNGFS